MRFETNEGLQRYIHEINKYPQLSTEDEFKLGRRIQASIGAPIRKVSLNKKGSEKVTTVKPDPTDMESVNKLVQANLKFVIKMANKFIGQNVSIEDLINSGNIGMIEAAKRYDPDTNPVRFITYASRWIQKYLNNELDENSKIVRIPKNQSYDLYKRRKAGEEVNTRTVEIDKPITSDSENTIGDIMLKRDAEAHETIEHDSNNYIVMMLMKNLNEEETQVVKLRYGFSGEETMTNKEISETLKMPIQVVGRAMKSARFKMREAKERLNLA